MLQIDEKDLKLYLEKNKKKIESGKIVGIVDVFSGFSLIATLSSGDFSGITIFPPIYFEIFAWSFAIAFIVYGIAKFIFNKKNGIKIVQIYDSIEKLDMKKRHEFVIVLIKNSSVKGEYLLSYSQRWKCKLFLDYKINGEFDSDDTEKVSSFIKEFLNWDIKPNMIRYLGCLNSEKYSVGDKITKKYYFHFYTTTIGTLETKFKSFKYNGKKFYWLTLDKMYKDRNIVNKNADVLDFIRTHKIIS